MEPHLIIVVGTTPDYVLRIEEEEKPYHMLFLLDSKFKGFPELEKKDNSDHLFSNLEDYSGTLNILIKYIAASNLKPYFACFDCEALYLTGRLAEYFDSPFPPPDAVLKARNKFLSSRLWMNERVKTPECELASGLSYSIELFNKYNRDAVIKPLTGSGSELVFHCTDEKEIEEAVEIIKTQLEKRKENPLFYPLMDPVSREMIDPCRFWIVEEFVSGPEYSCDFFMENSSIHILRETEKIKDRACEFGTISGYLMPPVYPASIKKDDIKSAMMKAANSLGFSWGYFMADFIVNDNMISIIELTPRPGGDSLPDLIKASTGINILITYLDIMTGSNGPLEGFPEPAGRHATVHFYSDREGIIDKIDTEEIIKDSRTKFILLKKKPGDSITLPPDDYDNRLIGYSVITLDAEESPISVCNEMQNKLKVTYSVPC